MRGNTIIIEDPFPEYEEEREKKAIKDGKSEEEIAKEGEIIEGYITPAKKE